MNNIYTELIKNYLKEDTYPFDITVESLNNNFNSECTATIYSRDTGILCGLEFVKLIFKCLDSSIEFNEYHHDSDTIKNEKIIEIIGNSKSILQGERTALNMLQILSGIATYTSKFIKKLNNSNIKLLDTRKTTPGFRIFQKFAFKTGGGVNHRYNLAQMILVKENHFALFNSTEDLLKSLFTNINYPVKIEIEVTDINMLKQVLNYNPDIIMLDNFEHSEIEKAIDIINKKCLIEISGNINIDNVSEYSHYDIDFISTSKPIVNAQPIDFSMIIK